MLHACGHVAAAVCGVVGVNALAGPAEGSILSNSTSACDRVSASLLFAIPLSMCGADKGSSRPLFKAPGQGFLQRRHSLTLLLVEQVAALAGLVCDMKLDIWSLKRQEDSLELLLQLVADLLLKHTQPDALDACLRTLVHCTTQGNDTIQVCSSAYKLIMPVNLTTPLTAVVYYCSRYYAGTGKFSFTSPLMHTRHTSALCYCPFHEAK